MQVHRNIDQLPKFRQAVVTIGTFDGVHLGHQQIIRQMKAEALVTGGETVIITFYPHPRVVIRGRDKGEILLLNSLEEKIELLAKHGIDHLVVVPFTEAFAAMDARDYVSGFLVDRFHPAVLIIGYDHRFGKNRSGDYELLERLGPGFGFRVIEIPEHVLHTVTISSTRIRKALLAGQLEEANENLGYAYQLSGTVVEGNKRGRTIGFPTANLEPEDQDKLVPADGVYAVTLTIRGREGLYKGMMNIGYRPTVDGKTRTIEVNIFYFTDMIYGEVLHVTICKHLRSEQKFASLEALKAQLAADQIVAMAVLSHC
jgi:riboflavin kinase / FMN adenylyltransferase